MRTDELTAVLVLYGLCISGIAYDLILGPPSLGHLVDGAGRGRAFPLRIGRANLNKQYVIEGLSAGFLVLLGSIGLLLLMVMKSVHDGIVFAALLSMLGLTFWRYLVWPISRAQAEQATRVPSKSLPDSFVLRSASTPLRD